MESQVLGVREMFKLITLQRPGAIVTIAAVWLLSRAPLVPVGTPRRPD